MTDSHSPARDGEHTLPPPPTPSEPLPAGEKLALQAFVALENQVGLPIGFLRALRNEGSDWAFVIQMHAIVEAAASHSIAAAMREDRLLPVLQRLDMSNNATGKLAFIKALDLWADDERSFVRGLSELRNDLVHDVTNVSFQFAAHLVAMDPKQRAAFAKRFTLRTRHPTALEEKAAIERPRFSIWWGVIVLLAQTYGHKRNALLADLEQRMLEEKAAAFDSLMDSEDA